MSRKLTSEQERLCSRGFVNTELLPKVALLAIVLSCACAYGRALYIRYAARVQATAIYGDRRPPLTEAETRQWYSDMGVREGETLRRKDLLKFLEDSSNRQILFRNSNP